MASDNKIGLSRANLSPKKTAVCSRMKKNHYLPVFDTLIL